MAAADPVAVPDSLAEAVAFLVDRPGSQLLAGGTDFMVAVNEGRHRPDSVVVTRRIAELQGWQHLGDVVRLGASLSYRDLLEPPLAELCPALAQAARTVGSPQIRNAGTLGGNVVTASPAGDTLPVLAALEATVEVMGPSGMRLVPWADLVVGPKRTSLGPADIVVAVRVPPARGGQEYLKVGVRNAMVIALASAAVVVDTERQRVGIALGAVGPTPLRAEAAEAWLAERVDWSRHRFMSSEAGQAAAHQLPGLVADAARAIDDHRSSARYRTHAVGVLVARAAQRLFGGVA